MLLGTPPPPGSAVAVREQMDSALSFLCLLTSPLRPQCQIQGCGREWLTGPRHTIASYGPALGRGSSRVGLRRRQVPHPADPAQSVGESREARKSLYSRFGGLGALSLILTNICPVASRLGLRPNTEAAGSRGCTSASLRTPLALIDQPRR